MTQLTWTCLPRSFWYRIGLGILFCLGFAIYTCIGSHSSPYLPETIFDALGFLLTVVISLGKPGTNRRKNQNTSLTNALHRRIPDLFTLTCCGNALAICLYAAALVFHIVPDFPSWPDVSFLSSYLFLLLGMFFIPAQRLSATTRSRILLDGAMILTAIVTFNWYFVLGPAVLSGQGTALAKIVDAAYPILDLLTVCYALMMTVRSQTAHLGPILPLLAAGMFLTAGGDSVYNYISLHNILVLGTIPSFLPGNLLDMGGCVLIGGAAYALRWLDFQGISSTTTEHRRAENQSTPQDRPSFWQVVLPYAFVPAVIALAIMTLLSQHDGPLEIGVDVLSGLLLALVLVRQVLALRETHLSSQHVHQLNTELSAANTQLEELATTDPLTRLPNHRALMHQLHNELERAQRSHRALSLLFFDADRFKRVNDTYGHAAGDAVLCQIGKRASSAIRKGDTIGRFGGEEFIVLLPEADAQEARSIAERVRRTVAAEPVATEQVEGGLTATVSIGIATYPSDGQEEQALVSQADEAMYVAKRMGRNQVRSAQEARQLGQDVEVLALLQAQAKEDLLQREGHPPEQLRERYAMRMTSSLLSVLEHRDPGQSAHAHAVSDLATAIARRMGVDPQEILRIGMAALLHDIGLVAMPDQLLAKPAALTERERAQLGEHMDLGAQILEGSPFLTDLAPMTRHHHEYWNGQGLPDHLLAEQIPLASRIIAVAEAYDFIQREHPYQVGASAAVARAEVQRCAGTQFDPQVVEILLELLDEQDAGLDQHEPLPTGQLVP